MNRTVDLLQNFPYRALHMNRLLFTAYDSKYWKWSSGLYFPVYSRSMDSWSCFLTYGNHENILIVTLNLKFGLLKLLELTFCYVYCYFIVQLLKDGRFWLSFFTFLFLPMNDRLFGACLEKIHWKQFIWIMKIGKSHVLLLFFPPFFW